MLTQKSDKIWLYEERLSEACNFFSWMAWFLLTQVSVISNTVEWDIFFCRDSTTLWRRRNYAISLQLVTGTVLAYIFVIQSLQVEKKKRIERVFRLTVSHKQFWLQKFVSLKKKQISNIFGNIFILSYFDNLSFIIGPPVKAGYVFYGFRKVKCDVLWWLIGGRADVSLLTCVWIEFSFDENLGLASGFGRSSRNDMCWQVWRLSEKSGHGCRCWCWHDRIVQIFVCFYDIQSFSY